MSFACLIWTRAGWVLPIGKKSSGLTLTSRQAALSRHFTRMGLLEPGPLISPSCRVARRGTWMGVTGSSPRSAWSSNGGLPGRYTDRSAPQHRARRRLPSARYLTAPGPSAAPTELWYTKGDATGPGYVTVPRSSASLHILPLLGDAMSAMLLKNAHLDDFAEARDILIENGKIAQVAPAGVLPEPRTEDVLDCEGRAVIPGFVETHLHLDKALLDARMPNLAGTLEGAIKVTGALKARFTMEDVLERSRTVLDLAIAQGTTCIRTQPDVDPIVGTLGADAMLTLRDEYRGMIDLQVVAFPQEGIIKAPGELEMQIG